MTGGATPPLTGRGPQSMHLDELHRLRSLVMAAANLVNAAVRSGEPLQSPAHRDDLDAWVRTYLAYEAVYMAPRVCAACHVAKPLNAFRRTYSGKLSYREKAGSWTLRCEACIAAQRPTTEQLEVRAILAAQLSERRRGESGLDYWIDGPGAVAGRKERT